MDTEEQQTPPEPTARLLKVLVQPVFVVTDADGDVHEVVAEQRVVAGKQWREFGANSFDTLDLSAVASEWVAMSAAESPPPSTED